MWQTLHTLSFRFLCVFNYDINFHQQNEYCVSTLLFIYIFQDGKPALCNAAQYGHTELMQMLLDAGADLNAKDEVSIYDTLGKFGIAMMA